MSSWPAGQFFTRLYATHARAGSAHEVGWSKQSVCSTCFAAGFDRVGNLPFVSRTGKDTESTLRQFVLLVFVRSPPPSPARFLFGRGRARPVQGLASLHRWLDGARLDTVDRCLQTRCSRSRMLIDDQKSKRSPNMLKTVWKGCLFSSGTCFFCPGTCGPIPSQQTVIMYAIETSTVAALVVLCARLLA